MLGLLNLIFGWALKWWQSRGPSLIVVEAEKAGAAQSQLQTQDQAIETQRAASDAGNTVARGVASDGGVHQYAEADPANRAGS